MMLLALEFSSAHRSVALLEQRHEKPAVLLAELSDQGARTAKPLPLIESLLAQADIRRDQVDTLAVGLGPGSYTGIRSAIALAQGWQLARCARLIGVSSVECLAWQAQQQRWFGVVRIAIDAQRGEFYLADYLITEDARQITRALRLVTHDKLLAGAEAPGALLIGPQVPPALPNSRNVCPDAHALARLAAASTASVPGEQLEPIYLREVAFVKAPPARALPS